jgi:hypothetical protein
VKRGLVEKPEDWRWSSFRHHVTGEDSVVEIESQWTARKRERMGIYPTIRTPRLSQTTRKAEMFNNHSRDRSPLVADNLRFERSGIWR